jgi:mono/diheme cytochrome c family protein
VGAACQARLPEQDAFTPAGLARSADRYLSDAAFRRRALVDSLRSPDNGYSRLRLSQYGRGTSGWDLLPEWNPRTRPVSVAESASAPLPADTAPLWNGVRPRTDAEWIALGEKVFFGYPLRAEPALGTAIGAPEKAEALGLEHTADGVYPGILRFVDVDGTNQIGIACALCHSRVEGGRLVIGAARRRFDFGRLLVWHGEVTRRPRPAEEAARLLRWGPGRADITEDTDEDPVVIPFLFGLSAQSALTQGATLNHLGPVTLALRQETQLIEANHQRVRPPRELTWALSRFVYSLSPPARPAAPVDARAIARGESLFAAECERCHGNSVGGGRPVSARAIGTDQALAHGRARGTGMYRPPSLLRLADRAPYLHHGALATLDELLSPERLRADYRRGVLGPGPVPGHEYGTGLSTADRAALETYLRSM